MERVVTTKKQTSEKQAQEAARYLDLWEENLSLIAARGMEATDKVAPG